MPNIKAAKKAVRSSKRKQKHNLYWKERFKSAARELKKVIDAKAGEEVIKEKFIVLQKALDKAAKEKVIHKNKAGRVKSKYANKVAALAGKKPAKPKESKPAKKKKSSRTVGK